MKTTPSGTGRICREVRAQLPGVVDGSLDRWRRPLVERHLRRCRHCATELERQQALAAALEGLEVARAPDEGDPPPDLLDSILEHAAHPGVRERAAVPARGALSGARPALSMTLLVVAAAVGTAVGYAAWRAVRAARHWLEGRI